MIYVFSENTFLISIAIIIKCFIINLMLIFVDFYSPISIYMLLSLHKKSVIISMRANMYLFKLHTVVHIVIVTTGIISIPDNGPSINKFDYVHHLGHSK